MSARSVNLCVFSELQMLANVCAETLAEYFCRISVRELFFLKTATSVDPLMRQISLCIKRI